MTESNDGNQLARLLIDLQNKEPGSIGIDEVRSVVESIMDAARHELSNADNAVLPEILGLSEYIEGTKREIAALRPDEVKNEHLPTAADELDEIVAETADATHRIMDAAEAIMGVMGNVDDATGEILGDASNKIFEACSFQDITGQRVTKVVKALKEIESKVDSLIEALGDEISAYKDANPEQTKPAETPEPSEISDASLLDGPQLSGDAMSQDEIDKLLNSA